MAKILLIEDNDYVRRMYENILSIEKYEVTLATSGEEGIQKAKIEKPDLILLDVIMPKLNGIQVLEMLKADPQTKDIPVVMLTIVGEEEVIEKCLKLGARGYLIKPTLDPDQILTEIKNYLQKSS